MLRNTSLFCIVLFLFVPLTMAGAETDTTTTQLTAAQIVNKNVSARGGLEAWRAVRSLSMSGKMDAGKGVQLPFVMEMKRPRKMRLEIQFQGQAAVQVFDGANGWKLRPFLGRRDVDPYTAEEMKAASQQQDLDGPLVDYAAKGTKVELEGTEPVNGRDAYKLKLTLRGDQVRHVWVDAQTFLDVKIDGTRRMDGKPRPMFTYFRDYKSVQGLMIPYVLETSVEGVKDSHNMTIESVAVNANLEDSRFTKPQ